MAKTEYTLEAINDMFVKLQTIADEAPVVIPLPKKVVAVKIKSKYKKGQDFYSLSIDDDGKCEIDTYRISNIDKRGIYLIKVADYTWGNRAAIGKTFSKTKDYGWFKNIPSWCKYCYRKDEDIKLSGHMHTTKRAAWTDPYNLKYLNDPEDAAIRKRVVTAIKSALTRLKSAK